MIRQEGRIGLERTGKEQLEEVIDLLYRRKWITIVTFLLIASATAVYTLTQVPTYETNSIVMLDLTAANGAQGQRTVPMGEQLFAGGGRTLSGELFIIQNSHTIHRRVQTRLAEVRAEDGDAGTSAPQGRVRFDPSREATAIFVTATSPDPREAAMLANLYSQEYVRLTQDASRSYMSASRSFLEKQEEQRRQELRLAEDRISDYLKREGAVGLDQAGATIVAGLSQLEAQRDNAAIELQMRKSSLAVIQQELEHISPQLAQRIASQLDQRIKMAQSKLAELEVDRSNILLRYPNGTSQQLAQAGLPRIETQIQQLEGEIANLSEKYVQEVAATGGITEGAAGLSYIAELKRKAVEEQIRINGLEAQVGVLRERIGERERELQSIPDQSVELARLQRTKSHAEQMYQYVVQRLQETRVAEESEPGYAHILREAYVPGAPIQHDRMKNMILGLFLGLMAGLGLAVIYDKFDNRIYKPEQLLEKGHTVISTVPNLETLIKEVHGGAAFVQRGDRQISTTLVALNDPGSDPVESYRQLRTNIMFSRPDRIVQTLLVTSPGMGEGKSVNAANLAVAMAQSGRRTLLVDADLHRPRQQMLFGLAPEAPGLFQLLEDERKKVEGVAVPAADNLWVVPAGTVPAIGGGDDAPVQPLSEQIGSRRMRDLVRQWRDQYDTIIFDTPPVLALSDAMLLSTQCEATVLVVRAGQTKEAEVEQALERIRSVGSHVIGLLLNSFDISMAFGHAYKYSYSKYGPYAGNGYGAYAARGKRSKKKSASARS